MTLSHSAGARISRSAPIRAFLVDDSATMLEALVDLLQSDPRFEVVGIALSAEDAIAAAPRVQPDVITMDLGLRDGLNGLDATRALKAAVPEIRVVVVTLSDGKIIRRAAFEAGADAFVQKSAIADSLLEAISYVCREPVTGREGGG